MKNHIPSREECLRRTGVNYQFRVIDFGDWSGVLNKEIYDWAYFVMNNKPINFREYDKNWPSMAQKEIQKIMDVFAGSDIVLGIEHIGSTSIPGQAGKNIIDIMVGIRSMGDFSIIKSVLLKVGWGGNYEKIWAVENNKWVFFAKDTSEQKYSLCVTVYQGRVWELKIAFRDYMRQHPEEVEKLSLLKMKLKKSGCGFYNYTRGKEPFIIDILEKCGFSKEYYMNTFSHIRGGRQSWRGRDKSPR